ncbi:TPA: hypothetical protein QH236_004856 [Serratia liquefaciens]|nr:hypothetical protein [Serratia liquefaciens]
MTVLTEIGEMALSDAAHDYFFRPSFANMTRIGPPTEIVERFTELHHSEAPRIMKSAMEAYGKIPAWLADHINSMGGEALKAGIIVMQACCEDDVTPLVGEFVPSKRGRRAFVYRMGKLPVHDIIILAQSLITHGIIGKAKVRRLQRHETNAYVAEFSAFEYISAARNHFSMPRAEAEQLTMTEFQLLINAKYPEQKGFTAEEYDAVSDEYMKKKARRLAKAA